MLRPMKARLTNAGPWPRSFSSPIGNIGRMIEHDARHNRTVEIEARPFAGDHRAFMESVALGFSEHLTGEHPPKLESVLKSARAIGAYDGERLVGNAAANTFELTLPGGVLPAAGVTTVGVHP